MASREIETPPIDGGDRVGAPATDAQPTPPSGAPRGENQDPTGVAMNEDVLAELRRMSDRVEKLSTEYQGLHEYVMKGFSHFEARINRSREAEKEMKTELRSKQTSDMPGLMPSDVKPAKIERLSSTNVDEIRNWFRHARGYLKFYTVNPEEPRSVYWASGFLYGPVSKWWYSQVASTGDEVGAGFSGISAMEEGLIQEFCGRTPAKQARINLDRATQKTTVQKYANYFREQLLELPHRHEEDNVHDFQRGLKPSIRKEVALKNPKTLADAVQAALAVEAAERESDRDSTRRGRLAALDGADDTESEEDQDGDDTEEVEEDHDLLMVRRLTADEVEQYKKEGRCFVCKEKGHIANACPKKKTKGPKKPFKKNRPGN